MTTETSVHQLACSSLNIAWMMVLVLGSPLDAAFTQLPFRKKQAKTSVPDPNGQKRVVCVGENKQQHQHQGISINNQAHLTSRGKSPLSPLSMHKKKMQRAFLAALSFRSWIRQLIDHSPTSLGIFKPLSCSRCGGGHTRLLGCCRASPGSQVKVKPYPSRDELRR